MRIETTDIDVHHHVETARHMLHSSPITMSPIQVSGFAVLVVRDIGA